MVWLDGQEQRWKIGDNKVWDRYTADFSKWTKNAKISVPRVKAHQRVVSAEENFNHQVDSMTHSVDTSHVCHYPEGQRVRMEVIHGCPLTRLSAPSARH